MQRARLPGVYQRLLRLLLRDSIGRDIASDLAEEFDEVAARDGAAAARRWYARQVRRSIGARVGAATAGAVRSFLDVPAAWARHLRLGSEFRHDIAHAMRLLRKTPGLTVVAVLTLALGIGANTAYFSLVDAVLLNPIPLDDTDRLVAVREAHPTRPAIGLSGLVFQEVGRLGVFEETAAYQQNTLALVRDAAPELVWGHDVTPNFFSFLRVTPLLGRTFTRDDVATDPVVLSHAFWQRHFAGATDIIGRDIPLSNETQVPRRLVRTRRVIGVMPPAIQFPSWGVETSNYWIPQDLESQAFTGPFDRHLRNWTMLGRLGDGDIAAARAAADVLALRNDQQFPDASRDWRLDVRPMRELFSNSTFRVTSLGLSVAAGIVLLLACANIANFTLARSELRRREFAIRAAIGAARSRLLRQVLTESLFLAALGGGVGVFAAYWSVELVTAPLAIDLPRLRDVTVDVRALVFATMTVFATGILFGLVPALRASRARTNEMLKDAGQSAGASRGRRLFQRGLVVAQVALTLTLLFAAMLMLQSVSRFLRVDPGYDPDNLVMFMVSHFNFSAERRAARLEEIRRAFRELPGVTDLAISTHGARAPLTIEGRESTAEASQQLVATSGGDYFRTYGIPIIAGRSFTASDAAPGATATVVSEAFARRFWPDDTAVLKAFEDHRRVRYHVVGVVKDVVQNPEADVPAVYYVPYERHSTQTLSSFVTLRTAADPASLVPAIRRTLWNIDRATMPPRMMMLEATYDALVRPRRVLVRFLGAFAIIGLALATIGIVGTLANDVALRRREIGVRLALGARRADVVTMVVAQGVRLILAGVLFGVPAALAMTRLLESRLFAVDAADIWSWVVVSALLAAAGCAASYAPARRASRFDPMAILRED